MNHNLDIALYNSPKMYGYSFDIIRMYEIFWSREGFFK